MKEISFGKYLSTISIFAASSLSLSAQDNRPNIVLIMADDMGFECVGPNGGTSYQTPNIDQLASQGIIICGLFPLKFFLKTRMLVKTRVGISFMKQSFYFYSFN